MKNWQGKNKLCLVGDTLCLQLAADSIAEESAEWTGEGALLYKACGPPSHNKPFVVALLNEKSTAANTVGRIQSIHRASHWEDTRHCRAKHARKKAPSVKGSLGFVVWPNGYLWVGDWDKKKKQHVNVNRVSTVRGRSTTGELMSMRKQS